MKNRYQAVLDIVSGAVITLLATWILLALRSTENSAIVSQLYLLPVGFSAARWGWRGGISAALVAFLAFNYFFLAPYYTFTVHHSKDVITLIVFLAVAATISELISRARLSQANAEARQMEIQHLYELNNILSGLNEPERILHVLAQQTLDVFNALRVEIVINQLSENQVDASKIASQTASVEHLLPGQILPAQPDILIPLQSNPKMLGEARLWLGPTRIQSINERALQAFILRGMIALERAQMAGQRQRARTLAESDRLKSALLSSVSHELRTPLAAIKASVSTLLGEYQLEPEVEHDLLSAIEEETDQLNQLVSNLLSMSRLEAGALQLQRRWNSLQEIIQGVLQRMHLMTHVVSMDVSSDLPLLPVDYILMEQVFSNLLSNCAKYAPEKSLITIQAKPVSDQFLCVEITNQGPPVAEEHLNHIFDKFYRITQAEKVSGIGLGLSICKGIVEVHGGKIWAENTPEGFKFCLSLPLIWQGEQPYLPMQ